MDKTEKDVLAGGVGGIAGAAGSTGAATAAFAACCAIPIIGPALGLIAIPITIAAMSAGGAAAGVAARRVLSDD